MISFEVYEVYRAIESDCKDLPESVGLICFCKGVGQPGTARAETLT